MKHEFKFNIEVSTSFYADKGTSLNKVLKLENEIKRKILNETKEQSYYDFNNDLDCTGLVKYKIIK